MTRLAADRLACDRGGRRVFSQLSFALDAGQYLDLRGANGSGKSTLLRLIAGLCDSAEGTVALAGTERLGEACHYIGHADAAKAWLTVRENLEFWRGYFGGGDIARALGAFSLEPLAEDRAAFLSQGQKRRLALSRLALIDRPLWLLDEPTVGLDAHSLQQLSSLIDAHRKAGGMIVVATHAELLLRPDQTLTLGEPA